jgi:hypothetical protein
MNFRIRLVPEPMDRREEGGKQEATVRAEEEAFVDAVVESRNGGR